MRLHYEKTYPLRNLRVTFMLRGYKQGAQPWKQKGEYPNFGQESYERLKLRRASVVDHVSSNDLWQNS